MRRGLGLDFGRQALLCFAAVTLTHWFVNLLSYVRSPIARASFARF